jgi:polyisoprenoid-binding protein YceI
MRPCIHREQVMRQSQRAIVALIALWSVQARAETYELIEAQSFLYVEVRPDKGLLSKVAHQHVVRATKWTGSVKYEESAPEKCQVLIEIPVADLTVDEPVMRKRLKYDKPIADGDRKRVRDSMLDDDQLDGEKFGKITFASTGCKKIGEGKIEVTGDLEIRGVKKRVTVPMEVQLGGGKLRAKGQFALTHKDFGFEPYSAALGAIKNDEALTFNVRAIGAAKP